MNKLTFVLVMIVVSCKSSPDSFTTQSGVKFTVIHTKNDGIEAPRTSTVKVVPTRKKDSIHSHLPLYKVVTPAAPFISDPLADVLMTGVHEGDSLLITDTSGNKSIYKIEKVFIPGYQGLNADSLIKRDKRKEIGLMQKEQLQYGLSRVEQFVRTKNPKAVRYGDVYVEIFDKGVAPIADSGKKVGIKFSSRELQSGKVLMSNVDTNFHLPPVYEYVSGRKIMYKPVEDIVQQLGRGGKARVYMPAIIALGEKANNPTTDLTKDILFDIEIVSVK